MEELPTQEKELTPFEIIEVFRNPLVFIPYILFCIASFYSVFLLWTVKLHGVYWYTSVTIGALLVDIFIGLFSIHPFIFKLVLVCILWYFKNTLKPININKENHASIN